MSQDIKSKTRLNFPIEIKAKDCWVCAPDSFTTSWTVARQALLSVGFSWPDYWSGLPFPSPGNFPDPGIEPTSHSLAGEFFTSEPPGQDVLKQLSHL